MGGGQGATELRECALTRRHFVLQDERPDNLRAVDLVKLDPTLRNLVFTDGTVTRALEVHALSRVSVDVVAQTEETAAGPVPRCLDIPSGANVLRRQVVIGTGAAAPLLWAESHIVPSRLPPGFLDVLGEAPDGIGESLQRVQLESWRDMLWFGLDTLPEWSRSKRRGEPTALTRSYRVITKGRPALLISESFAVQQHADTYRLDWLT
jgi:chorismate-pyruvate lyase